MITRLEITTDLTVDDVCRIATDAGVDAKSWNEIIWSFEALRRWADELERRFGRLLCVDHHSPPNDPPDLMIHFARAIIPLEHTLLKPYPLGWAEPARAGRGGFVPPVVPRSWSRKELMDTITGFNHTWANASDTYDAVYAALDFAISEKIKRLPAGSIIVVDDRVTNYQEEREVLIQRLQARQSDFRNCIILFFQRNNSQQYWSSLVTRDEALTRVSQR